MMRTFNYLILLTLFLPVFSSHSEELSCQKIHIIQKRFLDHHISHKTLTSDLKNKVIDQFIKNLDRNKIYFLESDILNIKRKNKKLFTRLKNKKCKGLYYIYDIYLKRVEQRTLFASQYLKNFKFDKKLTYVLDEDLKKYPNSYQSANEKMKAYIQYQVANVFLFEKDLKKSVEQVSYITNNKKKQILSWKPQLSQLEIKQCADKSKHSFKACKPTKWLSNYLNAYSQSLDSHSSYLDNEDLEEFYISMNLELEGIGATLSSRFGYTIVEKLIPGGAAFNSKKLKTKDKILAVGQSKNNMVNIFGERIEDVVSIIRGKKGTPVFLKISREDEKKKRQIFTVKLIRDRVDLKEERASISYHNIKNKETNFNVGLIKVPSFYGSNSVFGGKSVSQDVKKLLIEAKLKKMQALVLDLSNNRGGSLDEAVQLSGLFFSKGNIVTQSEKNYHHVLKDKDERIFYKGPLVVLVNRLSASASEIVSGALQDYNRAVIVGGDHTFGKGSVQSVEPLFAKLGALKTTVGLYFIPSGRSTQKEGIKSDIVFPSIFNIDDLGEKTLDYALPSKTIKKFKSPLQELFSQESKQWQPVNNITIEKLKLASQKRVKQNKKFQKIKKQLKEFQERTKNRKTTTIAEVLENKNDEDEDPFKEENLSPTEKDQKKYLARPDVQEALNIAGDFVLIQKTNQTQNNRLNKKTIF